MLAALDVLLAVQTGDEPRSLASIDAFEQARGGFADPTIGELFTLAAEIAPPSVAARLARVER